MGHRGPGTSQLLGGALIAGKVRLRSSSGFNGAANTRVEGAAVLSKRSTVTSTAWPTAVRGDPWGSPALRAVLDCTCVHLLMHVAALVLLLAGKPSRRGSRGRSWATRPCSGPSKRHTQRVQAGSSGSREREAWRLGWRPARLLAGFKSTGQGLGSEGGASVVAKYEHMLSQGLLGCSGEAKWPGAGWQSITGSSRGVLSKCVHSSLVSGCADRSGLFKPMRRGVKG